MIDRHHLFNTSAHWKSTKESHRLRAMYLYPMERTEHENLHEDCPPVPLLGYFALSSILRDVNPVREVQHDVDELSFAIESAISNPKAHEIERSLGQLTIEAIRLQVPYIERGTSTIIDLSPIRGEFDV